MTTKAYQPRRHCQPWGGLWAKVSIGPGRTASPFSKCSGGGLRSLGVKEVDLINRSLIRRTVGLVFNWAIALVLVVATYVGVSHFRTITFSPQRTQRTATAIELPRAPSSPSTANT